MPTTATSTRLGKKGWPFLYYSGFLKREANYKVNIINNLLRQKFYNLKIMYEDFLYSHSIIRLRGRFLIIYCYLHDEYITRRIVDSICRHKTITNHLNVEFYERCLYKYGYGRLKLIKDPIKFIIRDLICAKFASFIVFKFFFLNCQKNYSIWLYGNFIKRRLEQKYSLYRVIKPLVRGISALPTIKGLKFKCVGRFNRIQRVKTHYFQYGKVGFNSLSGALEYYMIEPILKYSICSIKIWINYKFNKLTSPYRVLSGLQFFYKKKIKKTLTIIFLMRKLLLVPKVNIRKKLFSYLLFKRFVSICRYKLKPLIIITKHSFKFIKKSIHLKKFVTNIYLKQNLNFFFKFYKFNLKISKQLTKFNACDKIFSQDFYWFLYMHSRIFKK
jgi:hypothetical protein